eukprot:TRINITY_DN10924_c0_g1_i1.p1 TRINITY_DN10924_c0_g1~~TRINITY_DN10924_c0_g1_i1.p1  ORF type:complete len:145 (+),score=21.35 TRINITY_DN10924_c0_g1_i1:137-571(+)
MMEELRETIDFVKSMKKSIKITQKRKILQKDIELAEQRGNHAEYMKLMEKSADLAFDIKDYKHALKRYKTVLKTAEKHNDMKTIISMRSSICNTFEMLAEEEPSKSKEYLENSIELYKLNINTYKELKDNLGLAQVYYDQRAPL